MQGCPDQAPSLTGWSPTTARDVDELRSIIAAIGENLEVPLAAIREEIGPLLTRMDPKATISPHLTTAVAMCDHVAEMTRRYLDYIDQAEALPLPQLRPERPDDLLGEIDRRLLPDALGRGIAWSCSIDGPIRAIRTDRTLCLEALLEWASLAIETAQPGNSVSFVATFPDSRAPDADRICLTLASSAPEVIADLGNLRDDPLFGRAVCLEEVGSDAGSRLALSMERLVMIGGDVDFGVPENGMIRWVRFRFPAATSLRA